MARKVDRPAASRATELADEAYINWLLHPSLKDLVPNPFARKVVKRLLAKFPYDPEMPGVKVNGGSITEAGLATGACVRIMDRILHGRNANGVTFNYVDRIVSYLNDDDLTDELEKHGPPIGKPGWGDDVDACRDCGTFFHPHFSGGRCTLCYGREQNLAHNPNATNWRLELNSGRALWDAVKCFGYDDVIFAGIITTEQRHRWAREGKPARVRRSRAQEQLLRNQTRPPSQSPEARRAARAARTA